MKTIKAKRYAYGDDRKPNLQELLALEALDARREAVHKRRASRMMMHAARHLPAEIPLCKLDHAYDWHFAAKFERAEAFVPTLTFTIAPPPESWRDKERHRLLYREAGRNLRRALGIHHMRRGMSTRGDNNFPYWYFTAKTSLGGVTFNVVLDLGDFVPDKCTRRVDHESREVRTHRTYTAYCSR